MIAAVAVVYVFVAVAVFCVFVVFTGVDIDAAMIFL